LAYLPENLGKRLSIDENGSSNGEFILFWPTKQQRKAGPVAMIAGTKADVLYIYYWKNPLNSAQ
jgi:hypothetical protein